MMLSIRKSNAVLLIVFIAAYCFGQEPPTPTPYIINDIIILGNTHTSASAMRNYIPYHIGETYNPQKTGTLIRNLYHNLNRFRNIELKGDIVEGNKLNLYVIVEEKTPLKFVRFEGNKNIETKELRKKIDFNIAAIDPEELKIFSEQIRKLYLEKGFENVSIEPIFTLDDQGKAEVTFKIIEGKKGRIRKIRFEGNKAISNKELRNTIYTREEWILSLLDKTGTYHPERMEADKYMIEQHYQNNGYMKAKVLDVIIDKDPTRPIMDMTFVIEEGDKYTFGTVDAKSNTVLSSDFLRANIPIFPGQPYSRELIQNSMKRLEKVWGDLGYIFAHVEPAIDIDEENKKINIDFISDIGKQIKLNLISIKGNKKTRDKIIRRRLTLKEGYPLTQAQMDISKGSVSNLGFFERQDGVNWKIRRLDDENADLDLVVQEAKTGSANVQLSFGGKDASITSPLSGVSFQGTVADSNLFGTGTAVNLEASWAKDEQTLVFHLAQPWLFDRPITGAMDIYHRRPSFDMLSNLASAINSKITGGALTTGFITKPYWKILNNAQILLSFGIDSIHYKKSAAESTNEKEKNEKELSKQEKEIKAKFDDCSCKSVATIALRPTLPSDIDRFEARREFAHILLKEFKPGEFVWLAANIKQDKRNHPIHTSRGHKWELSTKVAVPSFQGRTSFIKISDMFYDQAVPETERVANKLFARDSSKIAYAKFFMDYTWYNPIINEYDLVFKLHMFFGLATPINNNAIPFNELFHIGGDKTVRGFSYGQIGPKFLGDTIGGKKAFFLNSELIFPITQDFNLKGLVFYDGGAGWDNPYVNDLNPNLIMDNSFEYRHSVGFGVRMLQPMPISIDWGFKLDPRKGENESQVHFGMSYNW